MSEEKNIPEESAEAKVNKVTDAVKATADATAETAQTVTGAVKSAAEATTDAVGDTKRSAVSAVEGAADSVEQATAQPAAKRKKKWPIVVGVIAAVAVLAGVGFFIWHEQPSFCAAICHTPMDAYLEGYEQEDNTTGTDKYGNAVANTHAMLAVSHRMHDLACLDCHEPSLGQQMHEGFMFVTGTYTVVEQVDGDGYGQLERNLSQLRENAGFPNESGQGDEFCLRSGCHDFTREVLMTATEESISFNPHRAQHGEIACSECHKSHRASVFYCTQCHSEAVEAMPDGWLTFQEGKAIADAAA